VIGGRCLAGLFEVALVLDAILLTGVVVDADALDELVSAGSEDHAVSPHDSAIVPRRVDLARDVLAAVGGGLAVVGVAEVRVRDAVLVHVRLLRSVPKNDRRSVVQVLLRVRGGVLVAVRRLPDGLAANALALGPLLVLGCVAPGPEPSRAVLAERAAVARLHRHRLRGRHRGLEELVLRAGLELGRCDSEVGRSNHRRLGKGGHLHRRARDTLG
jgi:hypothetical protein